MIKTTFTQKTILLATATPLAFMLATPAFAQDATTAAPAQTAQPAPTVAQDQTTDAGTGNDIVVTGTLFRRTDTETPSPVTVLSADSLQKRGINTVTDAIQSVSANGAGSMPNSWNAQGNFATGASAVSLRGLTSSSTLVIFDGLRNAFYPLADDGSRNFVDLNTIPDGIVERVEVLKDGASSTYGADAVAGVVNIITKKQIKGFHANASYGISEKGDSAEQRVDAQWGFGDLDEKGFNFYIAGEYQHNDELRNSDRGYPYNTSDFSKLCGPSLGRAPGTLTPDSDPGDAGYDPGYPAGATVCRTNSVAGGAQFDGTFGGQGTTIIPVVRPWNDATGAPVAGSRYAFINAADGCRNLPSYALTGDQLTNNPGPNGATNAGATSNPIQCLQDTRNLYGLITPREQRIGASARLTVNVGDRAQAYAMFNYYQNKTSFTGGPQAYRQNTPAGGNTFSTATLLLPVYVCDAGVGATNGENGCTAANGTLNPNNPYAAAGQKAYLVGDLPYVTSQDALSRAYRAAIGISGSFGDDWQYSVDLTGSRNDLRIKYNGYIYVQHLLDVIADGSYNFANPSANSDAVNNYITPENINKSNSQLYQAQASLSKALFDLPGGPFQFAVGGAIRYESDDAPSANLPDPDHPAERYFTLNAVGASGHRYVESGYFEANAPIVDQFEVNLSGRYDHYSSGQSNFSPKIGAKFTPIKQLAIRGTYSRGFRIPSFNEAYGLPTTGYLPNSTVDCSQFAAYCTAHGNDAYATGNYSIGLTSIGTANLKPEKSRNFTVGAIIEPISWLTFTVDYYNIRKTDLITGADYSPAIDAYYANNGVVNIPGLTVIPGTPDPNHPDALPQLGFIQYGFQNANSQLTSGLDLSLDARIPLSNSIRLTSSAEATHVFLYKTTFASGRTERYDGTLGPCNITSCSGTPSWRGTWQNTLEFADAGSLTATVNYTSGYSTEADDYGGIYKDCLASLGAATAAYRDSVTPVVCDVKHFVSVDLSGSINVDDRFTLYANALNIFGAKAPYDPTTYGGSNYNPAWANAGIIGRYFRVGARVNF